MAEMIIQNPSITSGAFASMLAFSSDNYTITAISGHPIAGVGGGGTPVEGYWRPSVNTDGDISWAWSLESTSTAPSTANIKGPQGIQGETGPQGPQGPSGTNGTDGKDGKDGTNGQDGAPGIDGISPIFTTSVTSDEQHPQGGTHVVLSGAAGESAFNVWNGVDGEGATVNLLDGTGIHIEHEAGTTNYTIGVSADYLKSVSVAANGSLAGSGTTNSPLALKTSAENALAAVDGKVSKPADTQGHNYYLWDSMSSLQNHWSNANSFMENWARLWLFDDTDPIISGVIGLSAGISDRDTLPIYKVGINTTNMNSDKLYGFTTNGWSEIDNWFMNRFQFENGVSGVPDMTNYKMHIGLSGDYLPTSGGTVTGRTNFSAATGQNILAVASAASLVGASRQSEANFGQNNNAMGTTWMGVGGPGMYRGFLKYTQGGNVGDLDSNNTMQVEFTPNNKGTIFAKAKNSGNDCPETQILNPTKASCDAMATSANANLVSGPNYMLAKNADGQFVIGAACVNCTDINNVTLAPNTYYFVYEV